MLKVDFNSMPEIGQSDESDYANANANPCL